MTFHDLFRQPTRCVGEGFPPDRQSELFPAVVAVARNVRLWRPGQPFITIGPRLLLGVVMWSGYDMNLLDMIEAATDIPPVDVYDIDPVWQNPAGQDEYIPGAAKFLQPPFAGLWHDGALVEAAVGYRANRLFSRVCRLDPAEVTSVMASIYTRH